ncbi:uncharacterized protein LOC126843898 isoform X1 [Adelges cooleyi]|uniref:uncharacterized protein LOC126843898 isoform X1 n=1 Tax=Adelges cooleyi TaxID=133065 RepID=UPI002180372F|nr:uncharacterized protein LOC126843898 isoform X1 [Adelges cooleyi]
MCFRSVVLSSKDRYVPDRQYCLAHSTSYYLDQEWASCAYEDFSYDTPYEYQRQREQQRRAFLQLQSIISLANGGHLLYGLSRKHDEAKHYNYDSQEGMTWPLRMVNYRKVKRHHLNTNNDARNQMLDMPNLSDDWMTKVIDWSSTGYLTAAIQSSIYLWSSQTQSIQHKIITSPEIDNVTRITCLKWDRRGTKLAYAVCSHQDLDSFDLDLSAASSSFTRSIPNADINTVVDEADEHMYSVDGTNVDDNNTLQTSTAAVVNERIDLTDTIEHAEQNDSSAISKKQTNSIKIWLLNEEASFVQLECVTSVACGCVHKSSDFTNDCSTVAMDWLADGQILVTGCTRATITFYRYISKLHQLNVVRVIHTNSKLQTMISCMHLSQDSESRYLAVAFHSQLRCKLKLWRIGKTTVDHCGQNADDAVIGLDSFTDNKSKLTLTEVLTDTYNSKDREQGGWVIKALAWHPWKFSLVCYAVTPVKSYDLLTRPLPSWLVLANACRGQVLKRVEQTTSQPCPTIQILSVDTHCMTFSRFTGELLVSASTVYRKNSNQNNSVVIVEHGVVVMHSLTCIVDMLSGSNSGKGLFTAWSPNGCRVAFTSTDESLRIWNFFPTDTQKPNGGDGGTAADPAKHYGRDKKKRNNSSYYCHHNNNLMSKLSFHASLVIK